ncbi:energy transducer TonB [Flavisolibacter sp. BT320]|nr:energy transducer TonB [Flavisolibacter longurius]
MKKYTWLLMAICHAFVGLSQGVKTNGFDKFLKKQRLEMETVQVSGLPQKDRLSLSYTAIASDLFLTLNGVGWGATTVDRENELVLFFSNDSSVSLKASALQSFEPGLTEHSYRHHYILNFRQLDALQRFDLVRLRKYSFNTYSDLTLPEENSAVIKKMSAAFLEELKRANINQAVKEIQVKNIRNYIGDSVTFCSKVFRTRYYKDSEDGPTLLDVQADFSDPFVNVVILEKDRAKFNGIPEERFLNQDVCISGVVRLRNNIPYLAVQSPAQIRIQTTKAEKAQQPRTDSSEIATTASASAGEALAEFPGGAKAFLAYLEKSLADVGRSKNSKQVIATFIIDAQGNCGGIKISESADTLLNEQVRKVLLKMPKWKPAFSNGRFVATRITQPITVKGV